MIEVRDNAAEFKAGLLACLEDLDRKLDEAYYKWTTTIFHDLIQNTPQWSGDTVSNWNYSVRAPDGNYHRLPYKDLAWPPSADHPPGQRGQYLFGIAGAEARLEQAPRPKWTDTVFFTNNTPIADQLEAMTIKVRSVNLVDGVVAMAKFMEAKWSVKSYAIRIR